MIRVGRPGDESDLAEVHVMSWQVAYEHIFPRDFLDSLDRKRREAWWQRFLEDGRIVHVAEVDRVVGFCHAAESRSDDEGWGEVYAIYVHPAHWGDGHGHRLLRAGEERLRDQGCQRAMLWVLEQNDQGRAFYERQGWSKGRPYRLEEIGGIQVGELRYEIEL